jgi:hypothetical protein
MNARSSRDPSVRLRVIWVGLNVAGVAYLLRLSHHGHCQWNLRLGHHGHRRDHHSLSHNGLRLHLPRGGEWEGGQKTWSGIGTR